MANGKMTRIVTQALAGFLLKSGMSVFSKPFIIIWRHDKISRL